VDVVAVLNDTTGTLLAGSYLDKHCGIGLIMGMTDWTDVISSTVHLMPSSHHQQGHDKTVLSCPCRRCGQNWHKSTLSATENFESVLSSLEKR